MRLAANALKAAVTVTVVIAFGTLILTAPRVWGVHAQKTTALTIAAVVLVLAFDAVGSAASRRWGFRYGRLAPVSYLIYFGIGFVAARIGDTDASLLVGATVAAVDASLGWAISWAIGPGRSEWSQSGRPLTVGRAVQVFVMTTLICGSLALVGGLVSALLQPTSWTYHR